jgi:thioredoxin 1
MSSLKEFSDANFQSDVLNNPLPVVVDFWATWCGPCKTLGPIIEDVSGNFAEKVVFGKLNIDESPAIAAKFGITSVPTLLFIKNGKVEAQHTGLLAKKPLLEKINKIFGIA